MTKILPKPKKLPKYPRNLKITKIPLKPKKLPKYPETQKNDQNTPETKNDQNTPEPKKITKIPLKSKNLPKYSSPTTKKIQYFTFILLKDKFSSLF